MTGYPKTSGKKKRKAHRASILHQKDGTCYLCAYFGSWKLHNDLQEHHIYGGPNRRISEAEGLKVYLCRSHHTDSREAVHRNAENMAILHRKGQEAYERTHSRQEFMELIGKNYL